jgi:hypothetical protein
VSFDETFIAQRKACEQDDDCVVVQYQRDCCGTYAVHGIADSERALFEACSPQPSSYPACGCASQQTRVEDGRFSAYFDLSDVAARCDAGACTSYVSTRACGTSGQSCEGGELCVVYQTTIGPAETLDHVCVENSCDGVLGCDCAQAVCDLRTDVGRSCVLDFGSDVYCADPRQ